MKKVKYKCGYCGCKFTLDFFNEQERPERNLGCPKCRIAGEKVKLLTKAVKEK